MGLLGHVITKLSSKLGALFYIPGAGVGTLIPPHPQWHFSICLL